jgi:hypothetical protein
VRGKEKYHSAFGIQHVERKRKWRFGRTIYTNVFRGILLWRRLRLPLTLKPPTLEPLTLDKITALTEV